MSPGSRVTVEMGTVTLSNVTVGQGEVRHSSVMVLYGVVYLLCSNGRASPS